MVILNQVSQERSYDHSTLRRIKMYNLIKSNPLFKICMKGIEHQKPQNKAYLKKHKQQTVNTSTVINYCVFSYLYRIRCQINNNET